MLNKSIVMTFVILKYKNYILSTFKIKVMRIRIWVLHPTNVHKNGDLITMPMHILQIQNYNSQKNQLLRPLYQLESSQDRF
jgi:hypothetical protein